MNAQIVVYAPVNAKNYPAWLDTLPEHIRVRSAEGLKAALDFGRKRPGTKVCLVLPHDMEDLTALAARHELFSGWKIVLELPDQNPEALKIARPLAPRFFGFKNENQAYLAEVVKWIAEHPTGWIADSKNAISMPSSI